MYKFKLASFLFLLTTFQSFAADNDLEIFLKRIQLKHELPGLSAAIAVDSKIILEAAVGVRKLGDESKLESTDKFHLGSCTKAMTATLAATFVEEGKLNWKSTLIELLPEFTINDAFKDITFDELLVHRSGLMVDPDDDYYEYLSELGTATARSELTQTVLKNNPSFKPRTYNYSNVGYIVAGFILEKLSGKSWEMLINERIFSPLQMNSCSFGPVSNPLSTIINQPWGHYKEDGIISPIHHDNAPFYGPSATVHCTMSDWSKFSAIHIEGFQGKSGLLKADSFKKLHTPYPEVGETYTYGGWNRLEREWANGTTLTHSGSNVINIAVIWLVPNKNASLMGVSNIGRESGRLGINETIGELIDLLK